MEREQVGSSEIHQLNQAVQSAMEMLRRTSPQMGGQFGGYGQGQMGGKFGQMGGQGWQDVERIGELVRERLRQVARERVREAVREQLTETLREKLDELFRERFKDEIRTALTQAQYGPHGFDLERVA